MIWPKGRASRRIWGLIASLALITPCLFSDQVFKLIVVKIDAKDAGESKEMARIYGGGLGP
jgi:hypothetical protein